MAECRAKTCKIAPKPGPKPNTKHGKKREEKSTELLIHRRGGSRAVSTYSSPGSQNGAPQPGEEKKRVSTSKKKANTVKQMLGELFGDWQYLENILMDEEEHLVNMKDEEASDEQKRRRLLREKRDALKSNNPAADDDDDKLVPRDTFTADIKKRKQQLSENVRDMCRKELQYLDERSQFWRQQKSPLMSRKPAVQSPGEEGMGERRRSSAFSGLSGRFTPNILNTLEDIEEDQALGKYPESLRKAEAALKKIQKCTGDAEMLRKDELVGTVYSLMGNAHFEQGRYGQALEYYEKDLNIAETHQLPEAKSRALDNLGRTYARKGQYEEAIRNRKQSALVRRTCRQRDKSCFEQKAGMVGNDLEATWLYHEMGRCYLETGDYRKARDCGQKSLESASFDRAWQLNAGMLLAQAEAHLENYEASLEALKKSLGIAEEDGDEEATEAITKAIEEVKLKMTEPKKKEKEQNATGAPSRRKENSAKGKTKDKKTSSSSSSATSGSAKKKTPSASTARSSSAKSGL